MRTLSLPYLPCVLAGIVVGAVTAQGGSFSSDFNSFGIPAGTRVAGTAAIDSVDGIGNSGVLKVTSAAGGQQGAYHISDFLNGDPVVNFRASFRVAIGGGTDRPADGMSFGLGTSVPDTFGEEGFGTGLVVTFDTWDNNGSDTAPAIDVRVNNTVIAVQSMSTGGPGNPYREGGRAPFNDVLLDGAGNPVSLQTYGHTLTDDGYVPVVIELFQDSTISVTWSNVVVFDHLPLQDGGGNNLYNPISGGEFAFGARTGGATETHWIDNLQIFANFNPGPATITTQPADATVDETRTATFSIALDGTPPFSIKWFRDGVEIPGADQPNYTTPPTTVGMNGSKYHAEVTSPESPTPVVSGDATLTVNPGTLLTGASTRGRTDKVYVTFSKNVKLNGTYSVDGGATVASPAYGASHSEVVLDASGLTPDSDYVLTVAGVSGEDSSLLLPDPSTAPFHNGFGAICINFDDGSLPDNTQTQGSAVIGDDGNGNPVMRLTDNGKTGLCAQYGIGYRTGEDVLSNLHAKWRSRVFSGNAADGYSFNWASDVPLASCSGSEEGSGAGLSVTVDTFDNGCNCDTGTDLGLEIKWKGNRVAYAHTTKSFLAKGSFVDAEVVVTPDGKATFTYDGIELNATLKDFSGIRKGNYSFVARTGGASEDAWVDDICINNATLGPISIVTPPADVTIGVSGDATFSAQVDGSYPYYYQWSVNGTPVPGATGPTFTMKATTLAQDGAKVKVTVNNDFSNATSSEATLHVTSTPPDFGAYCHDFNDNVLPDGTLAFSNQAGFSVVGGAGGDGIIHLTEAHVNGAEGVLWIPDQTGGAKLNRLLAKWKTLIGGGDGSGADGYSFNWGIDVPTQSGNTEGAGTGLSVTVDTWDNGCGNCQDVGTDLGIEIKWQGNRVAYMHTDKAALRKNEFVDTECMVTPDGHAVFNYNGLVISADLPGFSGFTAGAFSFAASTGGENDNQWIDDVKINCYAGGALTVTQQPADAVVQPGATVTLVADVDGLFPYTYQWTKNGVDIPGANYRVYTTPAITASANYQLKITNPIGNAATRVAVITVAPRLSISGPVDGKVTLTWDVAGFKLQKTSALAGDATVWTDVGGSSPVEAAASDAGGVFYRLIQN
jgi:hypothetical protein